MPSPMATATATVASFTPLPFCSLLPSSSCFCRPPPTSYSSSPRQEMKRSLSAASTLLAVAGAGLAFSVSPAGALALDVLSGLPEPENALSLPTWAIHVSSVIEWVTAMVLVWEYGERSGFQRWKGLSWGMVPLLGGAMCACTWHFFYNSESLEILVALQSVLTVIGNITMCIAAFRIFRASQEG